MDWREELAAREAAFTEAMAREDPEEAYEIARRPLPADAPEDAQRPWGPSAASPAWPPSAATFDGGRRMKVYAVLAACLLDHQAGPRARYSRSPGRKARPFAWTALAVAVLCLLPAPAPAAQRVALVIGNGAYEHTDPLKNPENDADGMVAALGRLGFEVVLGKDLDHDGFFDKVGEFVAATRVIEGVGDVSILGIGGLAGGTRPVPASIRSPLHGAG